MSPPISVVTRAVLVLTTQYTIKLQPPLRLSSIIQIVCFYCLQFWVEIEFNCPSVDWGWPCVSEACLPQIRDGGWRDELSSHHITFRTEFAFKLKAQNPIENESGCFKLSLQKVRRIHVNVLLLTHCSIQRRFHAFSKAPSASADGILYCKLFC